MIYNKIIQAKQEYYSRFQTYPKFIKMNYDTALMAISRETGGEMVCFDLFGKDIICDMKLIVSDKLKNMELVVGGEELLENSKT